MTGSPSVRHIPADDLKALMVAILEAQDVLPDHAEITAQRLLEADLRGRYGHGVSRLVPYSGRIRAGGYNLRPDIAIRHETPVSALVDGDDGIGQVVVTRAVELAIDKARTSGIGWVGTTRSNHAGAAGIYTALALREGLAALYFAVASANAMPPWGGRERLLGTNPMAVAFPGGDGPGFELDIATTVASHGSIDVKEHAGEPLPEGWVADFDGNPITDPKRVGEGFLLPIGGYKGSGLNIMIGLLAGTMNGAAFGGSVVDFRRDGSTPTNTGQTILVFRPDLFAPREEYDRRVASVLREFRESAPMVAGEPVTLPGDNARATIERNLREGVPVPGVVVDRLRELATDVGAAADVLA